MAWTPPSSNGIKHATVGIVRSVRRVYYLPVSMLGELTQGSQFTSREWIDTLKAAGVQISMDGEGRWIDNVFIERL